MLYKCMHDTLLAQDNLHKNWPTCGNNTNDKLWKINHLVNGLWWFHFMGIMKTGLIDEFDSMLKVERPHNIIIKEND